MRKIDLEVIVGDVGTNTDEEAVYVWAFCASFMEEFDEISYLVF